MNEKADHGKVLLHLSVKKEEFDRLDFDTEGRPLLEKLFKDKKLIDEMESWINQGTDIVISVAPGHVKNTGCPSAVGPHPDPGLGPPPPGQRPPSKEEH